ncbi:hypothetical protein I6A84_11955 [Frankia sp. CNm7]|uniref:Uncharacterized protein n=1 Tax=Frankia nepalensis TaxID=1836974 RepID=A0A937RGJ1_9ACTN|nr:hypothetical protein [Frankia nepalensis]MBL7500110.1 hypothetical protein [Frankia nepalensis]MBL7512433.1 hypothetical protein [Frankia nepalensis]MBL7518805.1 hypothetical protein [Frankia nepalensis]MBL7628570.1 hypothetical protein [Frankia nepalensis]
MRTEPAARPAAPALTADDLLIVADPEDPVAAELTAYLAEHGRRAVTLDPFDAAQLFTVEVHSRPAGDPARLADGDAGAQVVVSVVPTVPMFLRVPDLADAAASFDARFQYQECVAQLWAAAALTDAAVVNRPTSRAFGGAVSDSAALTERRAEEPAGSVEVFAATFPDPAEQVDEGWWVRDAVTGHTAVWPRRPDGDGPYRARWSAADPAFEIVVVLGADAWRCTTAEIDHLELTTRSVTLAGRLGLTLAAVVWRVDADGGRARLVEVDPFPGVELLRMTWLGLGPRLLTLLFGDRK